MEALWVGVAYGLGLLASRVGLPPLVGYLIAGFVLGAFGVSGSEMLERIAEIGVLLLLFTVGLKLRLANLLRPEVLGVGSLHLIIAGSVTAIGLWAMLGSVAWYVGISLAFSSTVLAIKLLEEKRELSTYHGRIVVGILVLQDLVAVALLVLAGVKTPTLWGLVFLALPLLRRLVKWVLEKSGHDELLLLYGLTLALAGGSLAELAGLSPELGALLFGAILASHPQTTELSRTLWGLKEAFLVAFFLEIGLHGFPEASLLWTGLLMLLTLPLQFALFFGLFVLSGLRSRTAFVTSAALTTFSEFTLITTYAAVQSGQLAESWYTLLGLVVAVSLILAAPLNRNAHALYRRFEPFLLRFERQGRHPDAEPTQLGAAKWLVVGMGRTGGAAYKMLESKGERVVGLDADPEKLERHLAKKRRVVYGDSEDPELWERLDLSGLKGILLTMPELEAKLQALEGLKKRNFPGIMAATSYHHEEDPVLHKAGATLIFHPFAEAGERLAERALGLNLTENADIELVERY